MIGVVALLVLGPKRLPEVARTLGRGLGEFRRASNELRQSLAIDEIQNELRGGLTGGGATRRPMKRPEADDRPAQAGDELPSDASAPPAPHPGELPLDADPHEHHDVDAAGGGADEGAREAAAPTAPVRDADPELGTVPVARRANQPRDPATPTHEPSASTPPDEATDDASAAERERG